MMNNLKLLLLSAILLMGFTILAQNVELMRYVFASGGESATSDDIYMSWTVGQSGLVGSFSQEDIYFVAGFQHSDLQVGIENLLYDPSSLKVYPNPFKDNFNFFLDLEMIGELSYHLYDNNGKVVFEKLCIPISGNSIEETVNLTNFPPGMYNLILFIFSRHQSTEKISIKLIKQ